MSSPVADDEPSMRQQFHNWLLEQGFAQQETPPAGRSYRSSHIDLLWHCYRYATLTERAKQQRN